MDIQVAERLNLPVRSAARFKRYPRCIRNCGRKSIQAGLPEIPLRGLILQFHAKFLWIVTQHEEIGCNGVLVNDTYRGTHSEA